MGPKPVDERFDHDLFRTELVNLTDHRHELVMTLPLESVSHSRVTNWLA